MTLKSNLNWFYDKLESENSENSSKLSNNAISTHLLDNTFFRIDSVTDYEMVLKKLYNSIYIKEIFY